MTKQPKSISLRSVAGVVAASTAMLAGLIGASPALALSPWWHLNAGVEPAILQPGQASTEVQELTVSATEGEFVLIEPIASNRGELINSEGQPEFAFFSFDAPASVVQEGLEGIYGAGNVQVSGGPSAEAGVKPYEIAFTGKLADQSLLPIQAEGAGATIKLTSRGRSDGRLQLTATNMGDTDLSGAGTPVTVSDNIPPGLTAVGIEGVADPNSSREAHLACSLETLSCRFGGTIAPYEEIRVFVDVNVNAGASSGEVNEAIVAGGDAPRVNMGRPVAIGSATTPTPFGVENYEMVPEEEGGAVDTQAGSHPFQLTTTLALNREYPKLVCPRGACYTEAETPELAKDLNFKLPTGLIGNPTPFPQCTLPQFLRSGFTDECPNDTALGVANVKVFVGAILGVPEETSITVPLFDLTPSAGEPARFGFIALGVPVYLDTSVRTGGDYGVTVKVSNITQAAEFLESRVTFWGVPGDPRHDNSRGWSCIRDEAFQGQTGVPLCATVGKHAPPPFLELPTSCTGPLQSTVEADSWLKGGSFTSYGLSTPLPALDGCNALPFSPSISVAPDGEAADTPTGLTVGVHVPQEVSLDGEGLGEADVRNTTVALPEGVALSPAASDGLQACSETQIALEADSPPSCPDASKVATVEIKTPLLANALTGAAYLAQQNANPFGSLFALYVVAQDPVSGTLVKLAGEVVPDERTGQLVSSFKNTPQLPFEDFKIHFFGGARAPLTTPPLCGSYTTKASIEPWSGNPASTPSSAFQMASGQNGAPCTNPLPFSPELTAGSTNIQAGAFTPFAMTMSRQDGNQNLDAIQLKMPPGLLGTLSGVKLCPEPQASEGLCGPESLIGETTISVGLGGDPYTVTGGKVYITEGYEGAPYGLSIVNPAKAGPFDLGKGACDCVVVRAKIEVDPITAALTVTSDTTGQYKIPEMLDGVPLEIKHVNVTVNRAGGFTFNPTNCEPMTIGGALTSSQGASSALHVPFQVTNCATLAFKPQFKVSTSGRTSRAKGASLDVKLSYPKAAWGSQANVRSVKVDLPKQLPSRLTTLQKACPDSTFNRDPASCPAGSRIGTAMASTPIIPVGLSGPAYFVSHGGAKFPELVIVLSGYGVTVQLHGETFISPAGITSSTFRTVPDVPIGSFELKLPQGTGSALAANGNLCTATLKMPTAFTAQNGAVIKQSTPIDVTGCTKKKAKDKHAAKHKKKAKHGN
jgi:hypothetical protein